MLFLSKGSRGKYQYQTGSTFIFVLKKEKNQYWMERGDKWTKMGNL